MKGIIIRLLVDNGLTHMQFDIPVISPFGEITGVSPFGFDIDYSANAGSYEELDDDILDALRSEISMQIEEYECAFMD